MSTTPSAIIFKRETLYGAYAPDFDVSAWGSCRDEALNNLQSELEARREPRSPGAAGEPPH
jgi:hypothetical protein